MLLAPRIYPIAKVQHSLFTTVAIAVAIMSHNVKEHVYNSYTV